MACCRSSAWEGVRRLGEGAESVGRPGSGNANNSGGGEFGRTSTKKRRMKEMRLSGGQSFLEKTGRSIRNGKKFEAPGGTKMR